MESYEQRRDRALAHYGKLLALAAALGIGAPPTCDFCGRPLQEGQQYRHPACNTIRGMNFGGRI